MKKGFNGVNASCEIPIIVSAALSAVGSTTIEFIANIAICAFAEATVSTGTITGGPTEHSLQGGAENTSFSFLFHLEVCRMLYFPPTIQRRKVGNNGANLNASLPRAFVTSMGRQGRGQIDEEAMRLARY